MRSYTQLTLEQRYQIYDFKRAGFNQTEIAAMIGRHKSTVGRELSRNTGLKGYRPAQAHRFALERRGIHVWSKFTEADWRRIETFIRKEWSPEQISGRLRLENNGTISPEWIYLHIYQDKAAGGDLWRHLRCQKQRRKRYGSYSRRGLLKNRVSIDERPAIVDRRSRIGDWEGDTIIGAGRSGALVSLVERKSAFVLIEKLLRKTAGKTSRAVTGLLEPFKETTHTLTVDNGKEFAEHAAIAKELDADVYFAHPYSSWERGTNENTNGLIRQYFAKKRNFRTITDQEVAHVMNRLNHRPRKKLGFKTPYEVFFKTDTLLTCCT